MVSLPHTDFKKSIAPRREWMHSGLPVDSYITSRNSLYSSLGVQLGYAHVFRGTRQVAMRATTSGTSTRKPGFLFDADLHGPHNNGNVMIPVVGEAAYATAHSADAVSWATVRWWSERWRGEKKKRRIEMGGGALLYTQQTVPSLSCHCHMPTFLFTLFTQEGALKPMSHYVNSL